MIVVIAGMQRSGSTFSFNVARETLLKTGTEVRWVTTNSLVDALSQSCEGGHLIIKSHAPDDSMTRLIFLGGAICICSYRSPEPAILSWISTFGHDFELALSQVEDWMIWHRRVARISINIPYKVIDDAPMEAIRLIQTATTGFDKDLAGDLVTRYSREAIHEKYSRMPRSHETIDIGFSYYDPETFFHVSHVSLARDGCKTALSEEQKRILQDRLRPFLADSGEYCFGIEAL